MPVVPTPPTVAPGTLTSSVANGLRDAIRFLQSPPLAELRQSVAQSIPNGAWTAVTFDVEDVDTDLDDAGGHSSGTNTRYTARYPGWYSLAGGAAWVTNATGQRGVYWAVNGTSVNGSQVLLSAISAFETCVPARLVLAYLAPGDYVEMYVYQSSGGALNTAVVLGAACQAAIKWVSV